jgi:hypothetical protein
MSILLQDSQIDLQRVKIDSDRHYPIQPDLWNVGGHQLITGDSFDVSYFGRGTLRVVTGHETIKTLAIKIYVTGRKEIPTYTTGTNKIRVKIEFLKDGEDSEFSGGYLYLFDS